MSVAVARDPEPGVVVTDCRSETGVTVGLIDSLIFIARVLTGRRLDAPEVAEALRDLRSDSDVLRLLNE